MEKNTRSNAMYRNSCAKEKPCIVEKPELVKDRRDIDVEIGQGEGKQDEKDGLECCFLLSLSYKV